MKSPLWLLLFLIFQIHLATAQEQALKITNTENTKEIILKENRRVRIKLTDGRKVSGRFRIIDGGTLAVKDYTIPLTDIAEFRRNPLFISILTSGLLIYGSAVTFGIGAIFAFFGESSGLWLWIPASALLYAGIKSPNFSRKIANDGTWTFEVVPILE